VKLETNLFPLCAGLVLAGSVACGASDPNEDNVTGLGSTPDGDATNGGGNNPDNGGGNGPTNGGGSGSILPDSIECEDTRVGSIRRSVCTVEAGTYGDMTWGPDHPFLLTTDLGAGNVFIQAGATLTILPGTTIFVDSNIGLVIEPGARIVADGTAADPIVFTSSADTPSRGDWGGLVINGFAPVNCGEGSITCRGSWLSGVYGGNDPDDDSGVLRYVRVEYPGNSGGAVDDLFSGISFQGVGRGTTVEYVQVHLAHDDGIRFSGGTVNAKHLVVTGAGGDSIDWTFGFQGNIQYAVIQQYDDEGDRGIEANNNFADNDALPRSDPVLSNFTVRGRGPNIDTMYPRINTLFREGMSGQMWASILSDSAVCIDVDQEATWDQLLAGNIAFRNNVLNCTEPYNDNEVEDDDDGNVKFEDPCALSGILADGATTCGDQVVTNPSAGNVAADPGFSLLVTEAGRAPVFIPSASGPAVGTTERGPDEHGDHPFFDSVTFSGAIDPNGTDWTASWTVFSPDATR